MSARKQLVDLAVAQLGIREATGNNDGVPSTKYAGGRSEPWCAHFVAWLHREIKQPIPGDVVPTPNRANPLASVAAMEGIASKHALLVRDPLPADVIFFKSRGRSDSGPGRHCGIVETVTKDYITTIEGNLSNMVCRCTYRKDNPRIAGFGRFIKE